MLRIENLTAGYGTAQVLFGVSFAIGAGEVVAMLGRNGMGKTTTIRAVMGLLRPWGGSVLVDGVDRAGAPPHRIARSGIGLVPEGRRVFPTLTVEENLVATARQAGAGTGWTQERVYGLFPRLAERRGHLGAQLSGGEQQMLAIGRALTTNPRLVILDEATEGLAPMVRDEIWRCLATLRSEGLAILVIDKNIDALQRLADRHIVLEKGEIVWEGSSDALAADTAVGARYLHL